MEITKELKDISWNVSEEVYRANPALSYSTLSRYEREGFNRLNHLFDQISSPSLTEGSIVDCLITGSKEDFRKQYFVADLPSLGEKELAIVNTLFLRYGENYNSLSDVPSEAILNVANELDFHKNWRDITRIENIIKAVSDYYAIKVQSKGKTVIDQRTFLKVHAMVNSLKESTSTQGYFANDDELSPIRRYYQLKFKARFGGIDYRCMADLILVDYEDKKIYPVDLKTSGHKEWDFQDSFEQWNYMIQARLYWRIIKANLKNDSYFKDFHLENYRFIVVNKESLTPLVWEFPLTTSQGTLVNKEGKEFRDPFIIGQELQKYLNLKPQVPEGIDKDGINMIDCLEVI